MAEDLIRYDIIIQDALRSAVRKILVEVNRAGLPGEHHFYIAFETTAPGVKISNRLKERYPKEMTIVLQHQFWDLQITEHAFEVGLSFGGVPEHLYVPFSAIKGFFDPSVQFALEFEPGKTGEELPAEFRIAERDLTPLKSSTHVLKLLLSRLKRKKPKPLPQPKTQLAMLKKTKKNLKLTKLLQKKAAVLRLFPWMHSAKRANRSDQEKGGRLINPTYG
ncbi:SspB family protein [Pseudovibrio denitrificans]|uniref:SspB family protein n=1 Tax=Pseudovibrio denitrificans TaxID=258256 RepID=UPI001AD91DBE|nr:ClpXP protease specificity-enhancing factor SspB [Pseudovibrio denitrificans]